MSFYLLLLCGMAGGILGGMGMGGGTALIPLLTLFLGVEQKTAQAINLLSFLPMACLALTYHAKSGLLRRGALLPLFGPALLFSALFSLAASMIPAAVLRFGFGGFLTILSIFRLIALFSSQRREKKCDEKKKY